MDPTSADAMETDGGGGGAAAGAGGGSDHVRHLLSLARQLIDQGKPSLALQAVMSATRTQGGDYVMLQTLQRARELYRNRLQANAAADQLASLFAECAIAEAQPVNQNQPQPSALQPPEGSIPTMMLDADNDNSILTKTGRKQIMLDAFSDGSSFICLQCGGLVSSLRKDEHLAYWCGKE